MSNLVKLLYEFLAEITHECKEASVTNGNRKKPTETPSRPSELKLPGSHTAAQG
ncbi:hypothetical protein S245_009759, partial [Arachis hypogaea]